jgi:hypothetical protein
VDRKYECGQKNLIVLKRVEYECECGVWSVEC